MLIVLPNMNEIWVARAVNRAKNNAAPQEPRGVHLPKIMQLALKTKPHYVIEIISEQFDKLGKEEQKKVLIHELMHIPHSFGGGFRSHRPHVTRKKVEQMYKKFLQAG